MQQQEQQEQVLQQDQHLDQLVLASSAGPWTSAAFLYCFRYVNFLLHPVHLAVGSAVWSEEYELQSFCFYAHGGP
jgi:hypothetical protein